MRLITILVALLLVVACQMPTASVSDQDDSLDRILNTYASSYGQPKGYTDIPDDGSRAYWFSVCEYAYTVEGEDYYYSWFSVQVAYDGTQWVLIGTAYSKPVLHGGCDE